MNKGLISVMVCGLCAAVLMSGCDDAPDDATRMLGTPPPPTVYVPFNADNPYDSAGVWHNQAIIYALCQLNSADSTTALCLAKTKAGMITWMTAHTQFSSAVIGEMFDSAGVDAAYMKSIPIAYLFNSYDLTIYNDGERDYIRRLINVFAMSVTVDEKRDSVLSIEDAAVHGSAPSVDMLCTISIAKYSFYLWTHVFVAYSKTSGKPTCVKPAEYLQMPYDIICADYNGWSQGVEEARKMGLSGSAFTDFAIMYKIETSANAYCMYYEGADRCEFYELMNCGN